jgi:hypothetical protein
MPNREITKAALVKVNAIREALGMEPVKAFPVASLEGLTAKGGWMRNCPVAQLTGAKVWENSLEFNSAKKAQTVSRKLRIGLWVEADVEQGDREQARAVGLPKAIKVYINAVDEEIVKKAGNG